MIQDIINAINEADFLSENETFKLYKECSLIVIQDEIKAQKLIVHILHNREKLDSTLDPILTDLVESVGFYPYLEKEHLRLESTDSLIRQSYHYSKNINKFLHEDQKHLLSLLHSDKNVIVSAPTSFGKSLLIEEFVASKVFLNIIIIQPTLALLDETRRKLNKYNDSYKLIVRTSQEYSTDQGNLFLFTAERVNEYPKFPHIDLLIIDEFYKLSAKRDDERADSLNNAFNYILKKFNSKFYLLGPNIDGISKGFTEKYNAVFYKTNSSLVDTLEIDIYSKHKKKFDKPRKFKAYKEDVLFNLLLDNIDEQSIIYCSSPSRVRYLATKFCKFIQENLDDKQVVELDIIEWIHENISKEWGLISLLNNKIGIHDGALQKHITTSIIEYFNKNQLNFLFCTTTIIEGVNTSAKNIIYFDSKKGANIPIDHFDYSNIKGRAGRLMVHYVGKIYNFNPIPDNHKMIIDIPFFEQSPISDEILIKLDNGEVKNRDTEQYISINTIPPDERELISNNNALVHGQKNIIDTLRSDLSENYNLISWDGIPKKEQLYYVLNLAWSFLIKPGESVRPMTINALVTITQIYAYKQNIFDLVDSNFKYFKDLADKEKKSAYDNMSDAEIHDEAIMQSFKTLKHWFEYKIPKWLSVMNSLQEFVCSEKGLRAGNYSYFSNLIESDFLNENMVILSEYGVPSSAIRKLEKILPKNISQDEVIAVIKKRKLYEDKVFIDYERKKLINSL